MEVDSVKLVPYSESYGLFCFSSLFWLLRDFWISVTKYLGMFPCFFLSIGGDFMYFRNASHSRDFKGCLSIWNCTHSLESTLMRLFVAQYSVHLIQTRALRIIRVEKDKQWVFPSMLLFFFCSLLFFFLNYFEKRKFLFVSLFRLYCWHMLELCGDA